MKRKEGILLFFLIAAALAGILLIQWRKHSAPSASRIRVEIGGQLFGEYDLSENQQIDLDGHNLLQVQNGSAFMTEADCPDQLCIRNFRIDHVGDTIVCLPNRVVVVGLGRPEDPPMADAVAG